MMKTLEKATNYTVILKGNNIEDETLMGMFYGMGYGTPLTKRDYMINGLERTAVEVQGTIRQKIKLIMEQNCHWYKDEPTVLMPATGKGKPNLCQKVFGLQPGREIHWVN